MIIGIDIRMLARGAKTGVEEYTVNLLFNMLQLNRNIKYKLFYNGYQKTKLEYDFLKLPNVELAQFNIPNKILDFSFRFLDCPKVDKLLNGIDIFFSPHIFLSSVSIKCKTVVTFHDLSFERHSEFYSTNKNYWHFSMNPKKQAERADQIIAVSQSTKDDLIDLYKINPEKIKVIYSGINLVSKDLNYELSLRGSHSDRSNPETTTQKIRLRDCRTPCGSFAMTARSKKIIKKYNLPEKYILYLGTLEPRKNIIGLIKAFEILKMKRNPPNPLCERGNILSFCKKEKRALPLSQKGAGEIPEYKLVIAGSKGWLYEDIFKTVKKSPVKDDIIFTGFVDDQDKSILYGLADLFVYPSFYEGFGFPPLEAMAVGTPVITSNFSSLPEAVGDAAIMVNPYNLDELSKAMEMVLSDEKLRDILISRGFEQIKKFSWQNCARETLDSILEQ